MRKKSSASMSHSSQDRSTLAKRAQQLRLQALSIAQGMRLGSFRSLYRGQGIEFSGVREYLRGDDVRSIDWNVTARMGKPFVKVFEEERELIIFIICDTSLSMDTGSGGFSRMQKAYETGSLLVFAAEHNASPVGAVFFDGAISFSCSPKSGKDQTMVLLSRFESRSGTSFKGSVLSNALRGAGKILKKRSLIFILSDFRSSGYETELARLALKHDVAAIRFTDETDTQLPDVGTLSFLDPESAQRQLLPLSNNAFKKAWRDAGINHLDRWTALCSKRGVRTLTISTADDCSFCLSRFFSIKRDARA